MTDDLSDLENSDPNLLPATLKSNPLDIPAAELEQARSKIIELEGLLAAEKKRADTLSSQIKGGWTKKSKELAKLRAENADLKAEIARLKAEREAAQSTSKMLPSVVRAETQLSVMQAQHSEEIGKMLAALGASEAKLGEAMATIDNLEYQRDERDDMLRQEEIKSRDAKRKQRLVSRQISQIRLDAIRKHDPELKDEQAQGKRGEVYLAKKRVLAALGNVSAQVELGYLDDDCPMCRASPACTRERLLNWPHGTLIRRDIQDYLQLLIDEAQEWGKDPYAAIETWASGGDMESFDVRDLPSIEPEGG